MRVQVAAESPLKILDLLSTLLQWILQVSNWR